MVELLSGCSVSTFSQKLTSHSCVSRDVQGKSFLKVYLQSLSGDIFLPKYPKNGHNYDSLPATLAGIDPRPTAAGRVKPQQIISEIYQRDVWGIWICLISDVFWRNVFFLSLKFGEIPKQREPQWNRRESTFHLVLWIATAENSEEINTKMSKGMLWWLDSCCPPLSSGSCCYSLVISSLFFHCVDVAWRLVSAHFTFNLLSSWIRGMDYRSPRTMVREESQTHATRAAVQLSRFRPMLLLLGTGKI